MNFSLSLVLALCLTWSTTWCSPLQLVPLEDEIQDALHNTRFVLSPETTTTSSTTSSTSSSSSSMQSQIDEFLSIDHKQVELNTTAKSDDEVDNKDHMAVHEDHGEDSVVHSRSNASWTSTDGVVSEHGVANISNSSNNSSSDQAVNTTGTQENLLPDEVKEHSNATIVLSGLSDDGESTAVLISESSNSTHDVRPLKKVNEDTRPSVLDFHPILNESSDQTIKFHANAPDEWRPYTKSLSTFLESYDKAAQADSVHCDFERTLGDDQTCRFDLVYLGPSCTKQNNFGYGIGKPCILFSPAKIHDWVPAAFDNETTSIPDEVHRLMRIFNSNFMFVTCEGESESDRANIGPMAYLPPYQGFPSYFFPYKGDTVPTYVAPLMAVEFLNPTNGTLISVVCRAWARNLDDLPRQANFRFSLQVN